MSEAEKKIREKYPKIHNGCPSYETLMEAAEFGYQLGKEEAMKELTRQAIEANSVKPIFDRAMASESNESSQDELWIELLRTTITKRINYLFDIEEAKKRYRITRITSESKEPKP